MKSAFFRQMCLTTLLILLVLTILGGVLRISVTSYMAEQNRQTLYTNANAVAELTRAYGAVGRINSQDFLIGVSLASRMADADAVICDTRGMVQICTCKDLECGHLGHEIPRDFTRKVLRQGESYSTGKLPGVYEEKRHIQALRLTDAVGETFGLVVVSTPAEDMTLLLRGMFRIFFTAALAVWLVALVVIALITRYEAKPLREMVQTVGRFGHGELSARVPLRKGTSREMEELTAAINNMAESLEKSDRRKTEFVSNVSHELKTPMTSIAGYLDGMLDGTIPQHQHHHYMQLVAGEVRRLSRLVRNMLEISRMQSDGVAQESLSRFDLGEMLTRTLLTFEQKIKERHLEVVLDLPEKPICAVANADSIAQVIYNLVENAVKFANDCGILTLRLYQEGGKALVTVKNTGPVIPATELPMIFDRFHKLDKSRSRDPGGVGLGLYIVKTIIGAHGEDIWVESFDGETAFTFTLPAVK